MPPEVSRNAKSTVVPTMGTDPDDADAESSIPNTGGYGEILFFHSNHRNFGTRKNFVLQRSPTFVRYKFSYSVGRVTFTCICAWFSYAAKFRTFSQKYERYEIKSRTKISAITVFWPKRGLGGKKVIFGHMLTKASRKRCRA